MKTKLFSPGHTMRTAFEVKQKTEKQRKSIFNGFIINNLLLILGVVVTCSGLLLQLGFHMGGSGGHDRGNQGIHSQSTTYDQVREIDLNKIVFGFNYSDWSTTHKIAIVFFSLFMLYHFYAHWKWVKAIITKHLIKKNSQVITLSIIFILVAITGFIPWFIDLSGSTNVKRLIFIEIHDKLTLIFIVYLLIHIIKRNNWFATTYTKLKSYKFQ